MDRASCRVCGVDLGDNKKDWRSITGHPCCSILTDIARSSLEASNPDSSSLDVKKFEEGYLCRACLRKVEKVYKLQMQVDELKIQLTTKVSQRVHLFQSTAPHVTLAAHNPPSASLTSQPSRKRSADNVLADPQHRKKRRKILQETESIPASSCESPDVQTSQASCFGISASYFTHTLLRTFFQKSEHNNKHHIILL